MEEDEAYWREGKLRGGWGKGKRVIREGRMEKGEVEEGETRGKVR